MWKHIFNTNQHQILWRDRETAASAARDAGYRFFNWNGMVLFVTDTIEVYETGITVEEMEHGFITQY